MSDTIPFEKKDVIEYLDKCIDFWRDVRDNTRPDFNDVPAVHKQFISHYYIDAYQSVRMSLFGELKP